MDSRLAALRILSEESRHKWYDQILHASQQDDKSVKDELSDDLMDVECTDEILFALSESNSDIKKFLTTDPSFNQKLSAKRIGAGFPKNFIMPLEIGEEQISPFQTHMGRFLWRQYQKHQDLECLEEACKLKEFHAIQERIVLYQDDLSTLISTPVVVDETDLEEGSEVSERYQKIHDEGMRIASEIYKLTLVLCNRYHALGCAESANILTGLAELYRALPGEQALLEKTHQPSQFLKVILETMAEDIFLALRFEHLPTSEKLAHDILQSRYERGIFLGLEQWMEQLSQKEQDKEPQVHAETKHAHLEWKEVKAVIQPFLEGFEIRDTVGFFKKVESEAEAISNKVPEYKKSIKTPG